MKQNAVWGQLALVAGILTAFCMTALFTTCNTNVRNAPYIAVSVMFAILCAGCMEQTETRQRQTCPADR